MNSKKMFYITLVISIVVQLITGAIELGTLFVKVPSGFNLIRQLLFLEVLVQIVEGVFYFWLAYNVNNVANITPKRYLDWVITTPTMLVTLMLYMIYINNSDEKTPLKPEELDFFRLINDNSNVIIPVLLLNWCMLLFGYLGEMKIMPVLSGVAIGFIPFLLFFYMIYKNYYSVNSASLFWYFFFFWSLYGFVAVLPYYLKNSLYNILDLFAKNFFGIFMSYTILTGKY
jgi:hypothetical protein